MANFLRSGGRWNIFRQWKTCNRCSAKGSDNKMLKNGFSNIAHSLAKEVFLTTRHYMNSFIRHAGKGRNERCKFLIDETFLLKILADQKFKCVYCKVKMGPEDSLQQFSLNKRNITDTFNPSNLIFSCRLCQLLHANDYSYQEFLELRNSEDKIFLPPFHKNTKHVQKKSRIIRNTAA